MDQITTVGIDLAKQVISVHGIDGSGKVVLRRTMRREKLAELIAQLPKCLIGMEACSGAHEWARQFQALGHEVRLMAPKFVIPYRKSGKNDGNDAEAICEAVGRPNMRFVPVKSVEQQGMFGEGPILPKSPSIGYARKFAQFRVDASRSSQNTVNWLLLSLLKICPSNMIVEIRFSDKVPRAIGNLAINQSKEVRQCLFAVARDLDVIGQPVFAEGPEGEFNIDRIIFNKQNFDCVPSHDAVPLSPRSTFRQCSGFRSVRTRWCEAR